MSKALGNATRKQSIFIIASILFLLAYEVLPKKQHDFTPANGYQTALYDDANMDGTSKPSWINEGRDWRCELILIGGRGHCGMTLSLDWSHRISHDFSGYDQVVVEIQGSPELQHVTMSLRNFVPDVSTWGDVESYQYISGTISKDELNRELTMELREFRVGEWWVEENNIPRKYQIPTYDKVTSVAFDINHLNPSGVYTIEIKSVTFVGELISRATWYLCAVSCWLVMSFSQLVMTAIRAHQKSTVDRAMIKKMTVIQNDLIDQSAELEKRSTIDPLTQVLNRYGFELVLKSLADSRQNDSSTTLLLVDIDHFKHINDEYGHTAGDGVIFHIASMLNMHVRDLDSVVRWGGEEFLLCLPNCPIDRGKMIAEKIRIAVAATDIDDLPTLKVTISVGVASFKATENFEQAFNAADKALYQAKRKGRNRVITLDSEAESA